MVGFIEGLEQEETLREMMKKKPFVEFIRIIWYGDA